MKPRKPIRKVSSKRAKQNAEYTKLRKKFLEAHPFCQWWLAENGIGEEEAIASNGYTRKPSFSGGRFIGHICGQCPRSTDIHHMRGRFGSRLNDESHWMAVSREGHNAIHNNPKDAYEKGYLLPR